MSRHRKPRLRPTCAIAIGALVAFLGLLIPASAIAFDARLRAPLLDDPSPGAVSVPFEIRVSQSAAVPQPSHFEIAVEGFELDPGRTADLRIGSLDLITDSGDFNDKAIYSNGPGVDGVRTWTLDWQLADPIVATVEDGVGLGPGGNRAANPDSTLIGFTVPGNYHGFRLLGLSLRFNQEDHGLPTPGVGAVNPATAGGYLIRSRIQSAAPQRAVRISSTRVEIGAPKAKTRIAVSVNRRQVRPGGRVRFALRTVNGTTDTVRIWRGGKLLRRVKVRPRPRIFSWQAAPGLGPRVVRFRFKPVNGPGRRASVRVAR